MKKYTIEPSRHVETGVTIYEEGDLQDIEHCEAAAQIIKAAAVDVFNSNHRLVDVFHLHRESKRPKKGLTEFVVPQGVDPHGHILEFAKAAFDVYGGGFVASVDTSKSMVSNRATDQAIGELENLVREKSFGFIFLIQRQQDLLNTRVERLRQKVGGITVPSMHLLTLPEDEHSPFEQDQQVDPGPGLATL